MQLPARLPACFPAWRACLPHSPATNCPPRHRRPLWPPPPPSSGCFVAGKDAGRAYNTWPDMNGEWFPSEYFSQRLPGEPPQ